ncbi:MAG TPA: hypothetical protein VEX43_04545 [Chthoniobacterales bacterium]|nr:hypothetical protein [Chthoniobacterales bacterium]
METGLTLFRARLSQHHRTVGRIGLVLFAIVLLCATARTRGLNFTGDEPRYVYQAVSFGKQGDFNLSRDAWFSFCEKSNLPPTPEAVTSSPWHPVLMPILLSPFAAFLNLDQLRFVCLGVGFLGLAGLYKMLKAGGHRNWPCFFTLFFVFFSLPVAAYVQLVYVDIWLFTVVVWGLLSLHRPVESRWSYLWVPLLITVGPFIHLRMSLVAAGLFVLFLLKVRRANAPTWLKYLAPCAIAAFMAVVFVYQQFHFFGSLTGGGSLVTAPTVHAFYDRLLLQLFEHRHGLLAYSPIWILAFVGLIHGTIRNDALSTQAFVLLALYVITFIWGAASESFPARFWVPAIPFLAIGLARWVSFVKIPLRWVVFLPLATVTLANEALFLWQPSAVLQNRLYSRTYDFFFDQLGGFHLGILLPWDWFGLPIPHMEASLPLANRLAVATAIIVLGQIAAAFLRNKWAAIIASVGVLLTLGVTLSAAYAVPVNKRFYTEQRTSKLSRSTLLLDFVEPQRLTFLRFPVPINHWPSPPYPAELILEVKTANAPLYHERRIVRAGPIVLLPYSEPIQSISISAETGDKVKWVDREIEVFGKTNAAPLEGPAEVTSLGNTGLDVIGPEREPDGRADLCIRVTLPQRSLRQISAWEIETKRGHWLSSPNPHGWWPIASIPVENKSNPSSQTTIQLYFPDPEDLEKETVFILRARDRRGLPIFERSVLKGR